MDGDCECEEDDSSLYESSGKTEKISAKIACHEFKGKTRTCGINGSRQ